MGWIKKGSRGRNTTFRWLLAQCKLIMASAASLLYIIDAQAAQQQFPFAALSACAQPLQREIYVFLDSQTTSFGSPAPDGVGTSCVVQLLLLSLAGKSHQPARPTELQTRDIQASWTFHQATWLVGCQKRVALTFGVMMDG